MSCRKKAILLAMAGAPFPPWPAANLALVALWSGSVRTVQADIKLYILQRGEPSRLFTEQIRSQINNQINWLLYVLSKMAEPQTGVQIYMDRGPKQSAKGQGKAGHGKGGKGSKGKAKGAKGGKGRGKANPDDMET